MRKLAAVMFGVRVLAAFYLASLARRERHGRIVAGIAASAIVALVAFASQTPAPSAALPASIPTPVSAQLLETVRTAHPLTAPFEIAFDRPMDAASVAGALRIAPDAAITVSWDTAGRTLTVAPAGHWQPDTLYTVTVDQAARSIDGAALAAPVRSIILTARVGSAEITATRLTRGLARLDTAILVRLDRTLSPDAVRAALHIDPAVDGTLIQGTSSNEYLFTPSAPLAPDATYRVSLDGLVDADGIAFAATPSIELTTVGAPEVVRFRPRTGTRDVPRGAILSVRFTDRMDPASTAAAFTVTADGKPVKGKVTWAESGHVLVFRPSSSLPYGAGVRMTVAATALSRAGVPIAETATGTFRVVVKPKPKPKPTASTPITHSGGGGAVSGSWYSVEKYYLKLMNCTRTGGWVTSTGSCSSPGGRDVAPLALSAGISSKVSRPYAKLLATRGLCDHFVGGTPGDRLRRAGYTSYRWAENLGCRSGDPYAAVLGSHLFFQSEKSYNGGHYVNLMNSMYDRAGIGVWVYAGRVRLVVDFYHP